MLMMPWPRLRVKKICPAAASQTEARPQPAEVGVPDEGQAVGHASSRDARVGRAQGQHPDRQDDAEDEQQRHADLGQHLDALGDPAAAGRSN